MAELLFSKETIQQTVREIAFDLNREVASATFLVVTSGATLFAMDLFKEIDFPARLDFIKLKSYRGEVREGIRMISPPQLDYDEDDTVIIVEDICDSGETIKWLHEYMKEQLGVGQVLVVSLLYKNSSKHLVDYPGLLVKDEDFVFGYGLDIDEYDRNHKNIWKK